MRTGETALRDARDFVRQIEESGIAVSAAFLFGSYTSDQPTDDSDIDVAVASPDFTGFGFEDLGKIAHTKLRSNPDIEVHTFAAEDFNDENPMAREIMRTGIRLNSE